MRKSILYLWLTGLGFTVLAGLMLLHPPADRPASSRRLGNQRSLVSRLELTDICLFTEATYTRHPSLADRFVPFQDHPMAISHFPSECLIPPPAKESILYHSGAAGLAP